MCRIVLATLVGLVLSNCVRGDNAETSNPYDYQVILRFAPHRLLTPTFCRQLRDEVEDSVQAALGSLARVDVLEANVSPRAAWLDLASLDTHSEAGLAKRHFVEVSYADGQYVVRARQHDGATGLASPVVREARTADRAFVARLVTRFIDQDFGPVGTVVGFDKSTDRATLSLRGGNLAQAELARLVPVGSVFALARVEGSPPRGRPVESAYLVTSSPLTDGQCECKFVYRYQDQLANWSAVNYRALKLGTSRGQARLRFVDRDGLPPAGLQLRISPDGFRPSDPIRDQGALRNGAFDTAHGYDGLAFVAVASGDQKVAQIPVPVIDNRVTTCKVTPAAGGEDRQRLEFDVRNVHQRVRDILRRLDEQYRKLTKDADIKNHAEALADVTRSLDILDRELGSLSTEISRMREEASRVESNVGPAIDQCDVYVRQIRKRKEFLEISQGELQKAIDDEKKQEPERDNFLDLKRRARAQQKVADFDEALKTYDEMLNRFGEREDIRKLRDDLEKKWKLKNDAQRQARAFAYDVWPTVRSVDDVQTNLPKAREALKTLKGVGDRLTALKLLLATTTAGEILAKAAEEIANGESDSDKLNQRRIQQINDELQSFVKDLDEFVRSDDEKK
jgi:hypothetical protein